MIDDIINRIRAELTNTFDDVFSWFGKDDLLMNYLPVNGGWSIKRILEHVSLTNHFLLLLIRKATAKAIRQSKKTDYVGLLRHYELDWERIRLIGEHASFEWKRPQHMEPTGDMPEQDIIKELEKQMNECRDYLDQLKNGEGVLYKTMMSVNNIGKIDVYHYLLFLCQHAKRHLIQMQKVKEEFEVFKT